MSELPSGFSFDRTPRVLCHSKDLLGEGPLWDHRSGELLWVDILRGIVHHWSEDRGVGTLLECDLAIGSVFLAGSSDLLLATSKGIMRWRASSRELVLLTNPLAGQPMRFNDGRVDSRGRLWIGTIALDPARYAEPLGGLYRFDPNGAIKEMEAGLTISNGLDWSPDGNILYLTDTIRRTIYAYDFDADEGTIANRRIFIATAKEHGLPDGLVVDARGHLWSACFGGSCLREYDDCGLLIDTIALPVSCPTAVTFGGPAFSIAYVTTSRHALDASHREADAGSLLALTLPASGRPAIIFGEGAH